MGSVVVVERLWDGSGCLVRAVRILVWLLNLVHGACVVQLLEDVDI